jgi:hypothetical protein
MKTKSILNCALQIDADLDSLISKVSSFFDYKNMAK